MCYSSPKLSCPLLNILLLLHFLVPYTSFSWTTSSNSDSTQEKSHLDIALLSSLRNNDFPLYSASGLLQLNPHQASLSLQPHNLHCESFLTLCFFLSCMPTPTCTFSPATLCFIHSYLSCPKWKTTFLSSHSLWSPIAVSFYKDSTHISINCEDSACFLNFKNIDWATLIVYTADRTQR